MFVGDSQSTARGRRLPNVETRSRALKAGVDSAESIYWQRLQVEGPGVCMMTTDLEPLLCKAERHAVLTVLRDHPEWTLGHVFSHLEHDGPRAPLLRELTLGELLRDPCLDPLEIANDGGPPIDRKRRAEARRLMGECFDECVRLVLDEANGTAVAAAYLRARVGGPRWKLQASLRRLVAAGLVQRSGTTSATRYQTLRAHEERRP